MPHELHGDVPLGEAVSFWILGPIALAGALGMVTFRNAVHSALSLAANTATARQTERTEEML